MSLNILKETHLVSSFTACFIQTLHKQTWKIQTSDHNTQKKNSGKRELLFGELNELWRCGSLAHPAGVLINHCQPERTNLCCCTEPWLMCTLGVALKETQLNKAAQYLWKKNLVFNLHALLIPVYWSFNWLRQMNHHCSFSIGLRCDLDIYSRVSLRCMGLIGPHPTAQSWGYFGSLTQYLCLKICLFATEHSYCRPKFVRSQRCYYNTIKCHRKWRNPRFWEAQLPLNGTDIRLVLISTWRLYLLSYRFNGQIPSRAKAYLRIWMFNKSVVWFTSVKASSPEPNY